MKKDSCLIGVVGAEVNSIEQRQILSGIVARAQACGVQVSVLSNLYNPLEPARADCSDNRIYDLIGAPVFDALILLSESFVNPALSQRLRCLLEQRTDIPVLLVGTEPEWFDSARFQSINTSDRDDLEAITDHLIDRCGYTQIALLTGPLSLDISHVRIDGYRRSLEKHGIPFDEALVTEGDFWYYSGERLAERYLSGAQPMPQALICANDYMAFGVLDAFSAADKDIREYMAVAGYEHIPERNLHTPLLTTFRRNRHALGVAAVDILLRRLAREPEQPFIPPQGQMIGGQTCPGGMTVEQMHGELTRARTGRQYADWTLKSEMDSQLTECRNLDEFTQILGDFLFMVRNATDIVLCLYEDMFRQSDSRGDTLICRSINPWGDRRPFTAKQSELPALIRRSSKTAVCYLNPIFFKDELLGCCIAEYESPDTYDDTYRYWLKSVSNALEFLRLKSDVRYLLQCRTLSPSYDSMTGMFSRDGLRDALQFLLNARKPASVTAAAVRLTFAAGAQTSAEKTKSAVQSLLASTAVIKRFHGSSGIIGRLSENDFLLLFPGSAASPDMLADAVVTEICADPGCKAYTSDIQIAAVGAEIAAENARFPAVEQQMLGALNALQQLRSERRRSPHFERLYRLHRQIMRDPLTTAALQDAADSMNLNVNHFNRIYKQCIGVSFHQDTIRARLRHAKHLLISGDAPVTGVAEACGYTDGKYFIRQFSAETGCSPQQYRKKIREYFS